MCHAVPINYCFLIFFPWNIGFRFCNFYEIFFLSIKRIHFLCFTNCNNYFTTKLNIPKRNTLFIIILALKALILQLNITFLSIKILMNLIMSHYQHGYLLLPLTSLPYHPLFPARPQGYITYRDSAAVSRFELVVLPLFVM